MYTLRRALIRDTTVAMLKAAGTDALDRVYPTPMLAWRRDRPLPALGVSTLRERSVPLGLVGNSGPWQLRQALDLVIEVVVEVPGAANATPDARMRVDAQADLDRLCAQITLGLWTNPDWRNTCAIEGIERWETAVDPGRPEDTDRRTIAATITGTVNYTCIADPVIVDGFCSMVLDVDVIDPAADPNIKYPGPDGRIEVTLQIPRATDPPLCPPEPAFHGEA